MIGIVKNFYSPEECQALIDHPDNTWETATSKSIEGKVQTNGWRNADLAKRLPIAPKRIAEAFTAFNEAHYNLQLSGRMETAINRYIEGQYFKLHYDMILDDDMYNQEECRKISGAIQLSDPKDYDGGRLIIKGQAAPVDRGTLVVFHALTSHEVTPITRGTRYSMNIFAYGEFTL